MSAARPLTRRERLRLQTLDEIKQHALTQVAEGGAGALSLNAIAKAMGMSGPAIYRYYASREELLAALVTDGYGEVARVIREAADAGARRRPERRLADVSDAYLAWARANPYFYELLFSVRPEGYADPQEAIEAIQPGMVVLLELIGAIAHEAGAAGRAAPTFGPRLDAQLRRWSNLRGTDDGVPPPVLLLGVLTWTRVHGIVMLELAGILGDMQLDPSLLVRAELDAVVAAAGGGAAA